MMKIQISFYIIGVIYLFNFPFYITRDTTLLDLSIQLYRINNYFY